MRVCWIAMAALVATPLAAQDDAEQDYEAELEEFCNAIGKAPPLPGVEDPALTVRNLYPDPPALADGELPLTPRLQQLFESDDRRVCELDTPIGRLDFDWVVNGQDFLITDVSVETVETYAGLEDEPERVVVIARFKNFDTPNELRYYWEKAEDGWRLDDVASVSDEFPWTLSLLLKYGL